jgi:hypothetical protein
VPRGSVTRQSIRRPITRDALKVQEHIVDYEREPEAGLGDSSGEADEPTTTADAADAALASEHSEPDQADGSTPATDTDATDMNAADTNAAAADEAAQAQAPAETESTSADASASDFDSDADVMDDSFASAPKPPEWPAADLVNPDALGAEDAESRIAAAFVSGPDEPADVGDDSDAPVLADAASPSSGAVVAPGQDINLSQGGVQSIQAASVTLSQGGAAQVRADEMSVEQGGVGIARVGNLTLGKGASAFAVVADQATVEEGSDTFLVIARSFNGEVRPTVDWRSAMAFGAGLGLVLSILRRRR